MTRPARPLGRQCPCGCEGRIASHLYACRDGWARLPLPYRRAINRAYRSRPGGPQHEAAKAAADTWFQRNRPEGTPQ